MGISHSLTSHTLLSTPILGVIVSPIVCVYYPFIFFDERRAKKRDRESRKSLAETKNRNYIRSRVKDREKENNICFFMILLFKWNHSLNHFHTFKSLRPSTDVTPSLIWLCFTFTPIHLRVWEYKWIICNLGEVVKLVTPPQWREKKRMECIRESVFSMIHHHHPPKLAYSTLSIVPLGHPCASHWSD